MIRIVLNFVVFSAQKGCLSFYQRIEKENELKDNKKDVAENNPGYPITQGLLHSKG